MSFPLPTLPEFLYKFDMSSKPARLHKFKTMGRTPTGRIRVLEEGEARTFVTRFCHFDVDGFGYFSTKTGAIEEFIIRQKKTIDELKSRTKRYEENLNEAREALRAIETEEGSGS